MTTQKMKLAFALSTAVALSACSTVNTVMDQTKGYTNKAFSAVNNQTHDVATSVTYDDATGKPSLVSDSKGLGACNRSDELRSEVKDIIKTKQSDAALILTHTKFQDATETCAQHTAYKLGDKFGCAIENGNVVVKATGTEPATAKECSSENIFARLTEIKKNAYMPGGKYNP